MNAVLKIRFLFFFSVSVLPGAVFLSCADTAPEVVASNATVIFDYKDAETPPQMRLSVFAETGSDARRVSSIRIAPKTGGYEWTAEDPLLVGADGRQWAGYTNFAVPAGSTVPLGLYDLFYTDAEEHTVRTDFSVVYPEKLAGSKSSDVRNILGPSAKEILAVYTADGTLIYYDVRKPEWADDEAVWNEMKLASSIRTCWTLADNSVVCLMPVLTRPSSERKK